MPLPTLTLAQRTAVVTGGSSGIGRATALLLAEAGARVFVGDVTLDAANDETFAALGIVQVVCEVRREADLQQLVGRAVAETGRLDILVNNAGVGMVKQIADVTEADWRRCLDTNLTGAFFAIKHALPPMIAGGGGAIVNMASNAGLLPRAHDPVYSISKGALIALTKSLALCHAQDRVRINAVCPGPVHRTHMVDDDLAAAPDPAATRRKYLAASPLAQAYDRMIDPEEVAAAVLYLVSDAAAFVTGTAVAIDGGKALGVPPA